MIAGLHGRLAHKGADHLLVDTGPVVFKVLAPVSTLERFSEEGETVDIHTHLYVREDQLTLYGFSSEEELRFFQLVLSVSGIGPRAALAMLSTATVEALQSAIAQGDADVLARVPGIGKKTAARVVLELKGKMQALEISGPPGGIASGQREVAEALRSMGYSAREVQEGLSAIPRDEHVSLEQALMIALRHLGSHHG
ncbi:MAG: Holliday junction branch migration protein RuvA [Chloroflexi bacterium]|nr:Holliday junction branch migration protein RuvA [Chloroflexota bacterium]